MAQLRRIGGDAVIIGDQRQSGERRVKRPGADRSFLGVSVRFDHLSAIARLPLPLGLSDPIIERSKSLFQIKFAEGFNLNDRRAAEPRAQTYLPCVTQRPTSFCASAGAEIERPFVIDTTGLRP